MRESRRRLFISLCGMILLVCGLMETASAIGLPSGDVIPRVSRACQPFFDRGNQIAPFKRAMRCGITFSLPTAKVQRVFRPGEPRYVRLVVYSADPRLRGVRDPIREELLSVDASGVARASVRFLGGNARESVFIRGFVE